MSKNALFENFQIGNKLLKNRLAVAPMTRVTAREDGCATDRMVRYYERFALGGFGLVITEGIYPDRKFSQGYLFQPGITNGEQAKAWRPVVGAVHAAGSLIFAQLMHAGALSQGNIHSDVTAGPSAVEPKGEQLGFYRGTGKYPVPLEMTEQQIADVIAEFGHAARRAVEAGFDGVEIHGANGYLLDQFFTDYANQRNDKWGGDILSRLGLTLAVIAEVKRAVGSSVPVGVRISQSKVNDYTHRWSEGEEGAKDVFSALAKAGVDYIHVTEFVAWKPAFEGGAESLARLARRYAPAVPLIVNGGVLSAEDAANVLNEGADVIALGKAALANPDWPEQIRLDGTPAPFDFATLQPIAHVKDEELALLRP